MLWLRGWIYFVVCLGCFSGYCCWVVGFNGVYLLMVLFVITILLGLVIVCMVWCCLRLLRGFAAILFGFGLV